MESKAEQVRMWERARESENASVCGGRGEASSRRQERWIIRLREDGMMVGQRNTARDWYKRTWRTHTRTYDCYNMGAVVGTL